MRLSLLLLALLLGCGGGGESRPDFGWWGAAQEDLDFLDAPGQTLGLISPPTQARVAPLSDRARSLGLRPVLMLWPLIRNVDGLKPDWKDRLDAALKACGDCDYYLADEPYIQSTPWLPADLDAVVARLPGRRVLLSLSVIELQREVYVPPGVTVGANLYSSAGETPASARRYLDTLATYGRPLYITLDAVVMGRDCKDVRPEQVNAAIRLNEAMADWAKGRTSTYIAFNWHTSTDPANFFCGAQDIPALRDYIVRTYGK